MDSVGAARGDTVSRREALGTTEALIAQLAREVPKYPRLVEYRALRAALLGQLGRPADEVEALTALSTDAPAWPGRADAMVRVALLLDSLGRGADAATALEKFATAYPRDARAPDAWYNAISGELTLCYERLSYFRELARQLPALRRQQPARP